CNGRGLASVAALRTWTSWSVFHAWQCGHWPAHRRVSPPQSVQTNVVVDLGMERLYPRSAAWQGRRSLLQGQVVVSSERRDAALTYPRGGVLFISLPRLPGKAA